MTEHQRYGVVYSDEDYAGFIRRILIMMIDLLIVLPMIILGIWMDILIYQNTEYYDNSYCLYASLFMAYIYLTFVKASRFGTFGQRLTKTRIETIFGERPSQARMTLRLLYWIFGPINFATDLVFMLAVKERRSLRDCFCNTIVVRQGAVPSERQAPVHLARIYAMGLNLIYESCNSGTS